MLNRAILAKFPIFLPGMQKNTSIASKQLAVIVESLHPRVVYTLEMVLQDFLGIDSILIAEGEDGMIKAAQEAGIPMVGYLAYHEAVAGKLFSCNRLLYEDHIRPAEEEIPWDTLTERLLYEDCFARIFHALVQYEFLRPGLKLKLDAHLRYPDGDGSLVVHEWLQRISDVLEPIVPKSKRHPRKHAHEITIDVDQPWKYRNKPLKVRAGGFVKDVARGNDVTERMATLLGKKDPFDVLDVVRKVCPADMTKVFFLVGGNHPNDSRFDISIPAYQELVREWKAAGFEIGLHPSYETAFRDGLVDQEWKALEGVVGPVKISRQHYLRYGIPDTFRRLEKLGIQREYSLCLAGKPGAATGVALPYRWFDLAANRATQMEMVPAMVMDRTLQQYLKLSPENAQGVIAEWIGKVNAVQGKFVIILHNETFSESGEWKGWLPVIKSTVELLQL
jgi:hypothetical protein